MLAYDRSGASIAVLVTAGLVAVVAASWSTVRGLSRVQTQGMRALAAVVAFLVAATLVLELVTAAAYLVLSR